MFFLPRRVHRDPDLIEQVEMFDLLNSVDLARYNELLAQNGRTVRINATKPWAKAGEAATEFTGGTDDKYFMIVNYHRQPDSPYVPTIATGPAATTIEADFHVEPDPPLLEAGDETDGILIDIREAQQRPKKNRKTPRPRKPRQKRTDPG